MRLRNDESSVIISDSLRFACSLAHSDREEIKREREKRLKKCAENRWLGGSGSGIFAQGLFELVL